MNRSAFLITINPLNYNNISGDFEKINRFAFNGYNKKGDVNMNNDLLASKDYEIAKLQEKIIAITKEKEELKKEIAQLNSDIIEANGWAETLQTKVEFYENIFKKIKTIEFKG